MKLKIYLFYFCLYVLMFFFTLNFNYIEGDDAYTVLHHALGRDRILQPTYSSYHSMFDTLLNLLKFENEIWLRYFSIGISFLFGLISLILFAHLSYIKSLNIKSSAISVLILLPFIIPEILFNSLIINPSLLSITFILAAHILLLKYLKNHSKVLLLISFMFFGLGVSFRWVNGFYLFVLFGDFILSDDLKSKTLFVLKNIKESFLIFPFYILSILIFIQFSGFSIIDIVTTYNSGSNYIDGTEVSYLAFGSTSISFLTPAFLILVFLGIFYGIKKGTYRNLIWLFISIIPYVIIGFYPSLKYMINIFLILILITIQGYSILNKTYLKFILLSIIFVFWFVGFQIDSNSVWGPSFELKIKNIAHLNANNFNPDKSLNIKKINAVIGPGMAMPTMEGPRPLYGFGPVIFFKWNQLLSRHSEDRKQSILYAIKNDCRILQDVSHAFIYSKLSELNYGTIDKHNNVVDGFVFREFSNKKSSLIVNVVNEKHNLFDTSIMNEYLKSKRRVVVYTKYSNIITKMENIYKDKFEPKGPFWGVLYE